MKCVSELSELGTLNQAVVATIGTFDGVHLGHQAVLQGLKDAAAKRDALSLVITFSNHPRNILHSDRKPIPFLCTQEQKVRLLEEQGADLTALLEFSPDFAQQSAEDFLRTMKEAVPFCHLVLGHDSRFGFQREGSPEVIEKLGDKLGFTVEYLSPREEEGQVVSSSHIRQLILKGQLKDASKMLGRPYSISGKVQRSSGQGKAMGSPTANIELKGLCLPPLGVYAVTIQHGDRCSKGVANLGIAPTVKNVDKPLLEVHIFRFGEDLYGQEVEVDLHHFIRPERRFESIEALQDQIQKDIQVARTLLNTVGG